MSRRRFLGTVPAVAAALTLPIPVVPAGAALTEDPPSNPASPVRPAGDPSFRSWWVRTHLPTRAWPSADELDNPVAEVSEGRLFRVDGPQEGYRLPAWSPRSNQHVYIGAEAVGPVDPPFWAEYSDNGRWIDVRLTPLQHLRAMQGEDEVFRDLVTAGKQGLTQPGFYRIFSRVENETMDSRTDPTIQVRYYLKNVLYTQYFHGNGSAIHYNWWVSSWGYPGSQGCLGMRLNGARYVWDWASIGTPLVIHY
jgi:hypothetical protein